MDAALREHAADALSFTRPSGGFYFWCRLLTPVSTGALLACAAETRVSFLPGVLCHVQEPPTTSVRLSFSYAAPAEIREGVRRLAEAVRDAAVEQHAALGPARPLV
jgi:2-aminoadipate transaminase